MICKFKSRLHHTNPFPSTLDRPLHYRQKSNKNEKDRHTHQRHKNTTKNSRSLRSWLALQRVALCFSTRMEPQWHGTSCVWLGLTGMAVKGVGGGWGGDEKASRCFNKGEIIISAIIVPVLENVNQAYHCLPAMPHVAAFNLTSHQQFRGQQGHCKTQRGGGGMKERDRGKMKTNGDERERYDGDSS